MKNLKNEKKRVVINGYKQNCFFRDIPINPLLTSNPNSTQDKYFALERKNLPNGYVEELVEKDYPINPDSLYSYAESADYRNDPNQAIAQAPKRVNLGDVSGVQEFLANDPQRAMTTYRDVLNRVKQFNDLKKQEPKQEAKQELSGGNE